jgi:hypothetical protein
LLKYSFTLRDQSSACNLPPRHTETLFRRIITINNQTLLNTLMQTKSTSTPFWEHTKHCDVALGRHLAVFASGPGLVAQAQAGR